MENSGDDSHGSANGTQPQSITPVVPQVPVTSTGAENTLQLGLEQFVSAVIAPVTEAEKHKASEKTKQIGIEAGVQKKAIASVFWIVFGIIALAGLALFKGAVDLTKELIIALISGAGGFGIGRSTAQVQDE